MFNEKTISLPLAALHESPTNPRKTFNDAKLRELAESLKSQGLLQPIVVRPRLPDLTSQHCPEDGYEIVFGHRRVRAARLAELEFIPAFIREMTDEQVAIAQLHENLEREDVSPIEEAEGFDRLMRVHGVTAQQLIADTGKSKTYIYGRLKLNKLCPEVREACAAGGLPADVALKIARMPLHKLQVEALEEVREYEWVDGQHIPVGWMSVREGLAALDQRQFFIELSEAKFGLDDATLHPEGRTCSECPRRACNDPEMAEAFSADTCTDVACFKVREQAYYAARIAEHREAGTLIEGAAASAHLNRLSWPSNHLPTGYIRLDRTLGYQDGAPLIADVVNQMRATDPDSAPPIHLLSHDSGAPIEVLDREHLHAVYLAAGLKSPFAQAASQTITTEHDAEETDEDDDIEDDDQPASGGHLALPLTDEERAVRSNWNEVRLAIMRRVAEGRRSTDELRMIVATMLDSQYDVPSEISEVMGWTAELEPLEAYGADVEWLLDKLPSMTADQLGVVATLFAIWSAPVVKDARDTYPAQVQLAKAYGVDPLNPIPTPSTAARADKGANDKVEETADEPAAPAAAPAKSKTTARYRNSQTGETWSGRGLMPKWLRVAINGGAKLQDFEAGATPSEAAQAQTGEVAETAGQQSLLADLAGEEGQDQAGSAGRADEGAGDAGASDATCGANEPAEV